MGAIILIIDSDTRVPEDCFADAVSEMAESPEVAIIQHMSGVMQVANHFFENGIAHFTRGIQHAISYCAASGEGKLESLKLC
jgi:cellulose synthase/poly-beta-1,6-N-acetylglucosamine synthase-like glycosyltransferase